MFRQYYNNSIFKCQYIVLLAFYRYSYLNGLKMKKIDNTQEKVKKEPTKLQKTIGAIFVLIIAYNGVLLFSMIVFPRNTSKNRVGFVPNITDC